MDIDDDFDADSDAGDTSDDDLFFKRLEQKLHNGDNGTFLIWNCKKQCLKIGSNCQEIAGKCAETKVGNVKHVAVKRHIAVQEKTIS